MLRLIGDVGACCERNRLCGDFPRPAKQSLHRILGGLVNIGLQKPVLKLECFKTISFHGVTGFDVFVHSSVFDDFTKLLKGTPKKLVFRLPCFIEHDANGNG